MRGLDYVALAARVMAPFTQGVLSEDELQGLCKAAYGSFAHSAIVPLKQLDSQHFLLELFSRSDAGIQRCRAAIAGPIVRTIPDGNRQEADDCGCDFGRHGLCSH